jgi:hypothetical protein
LVGRLILCLLKHPVFGLREIKREVASIEARLDDPGFGLEEIKREVREIEQEVKKDGKPAGGPLTTGPFFIRTGQQNAINVKVQNTGHAAISAVVRLFSLDPCPELVQSVTIPQIGGGCCTVDAALTAAAGNFEVTICPTPANARIRAFVSLHTGAAATSAFEYVFRASEMLPKACNLCTLCPAADQPG